jgi:NitT/TauT family transport system permease protein
MARAETRGPRRRSRPIAAAILPPIAGAAFCIGLWWLAMIVLRIESYLAPTPPDVIAAFVRLPGYLLDNARVTLLEVTSGYAVTVGLGTAVGGALATNRILERALMPTLVALNAIPKLAFAPLLIVWIGFGPAPKVVMVVLLCFFPIVLAVATGLTRTPADLAELAESLAASRWQTFIRIRFPAALPQIFVGLKVAMPLAVIGALVGELSGSVAGLGFVIQTAGADTGAAFAAITLLALMSVALFYALSLAESLLLPWTRDTTG